MTISVGDKLPEATLSVMGADGPAQVELSSKLAGRKVVIFAVVGAFTGTCSTAHVPSFIRTKDAFAAKGVDEIICLTNNDPFVIQAWAEQTGAAKAGLTMLGDPSAAFAEAIGMRIDLPPAGIIGRTKRYSMLVEDGVVKELMLEENPGVCEVSGGEALLDKV